MPPEQIENLITEWEETNRQVLIGLAKVDDLMPFSVNSTTGTTAVTTVNIITRDVYLPFITPDKREEADIALTNLYTVAFRFTDEAEILDLLRSFQFDSAFEGKKSPVELFETAYSAFHQPVTKDDPVSTSLIPIREGINIIIDTLIKRRPRQEPAKNEIQKIQSIGNQLKIESISMDTINNLAYQWKMILDKYLSPAKQEDISRKEWGFRLNQVNLFIRSFLEGLDKSKMRPVS